MDTDVVTLLRELADELEEERKFVGRGFSLLRRMVAEAPELPALPNSSATERYLAEARQLLMDMYERRLIEPKP